MEKATHTRVINTSSIPPAVSVSHIAHSVSNVKSLSKQSSPLVVTPKGCRNRGRWVGRPEEILQKLFAGKEVSMKVLKERLGSNPTLATELFQVAHLREGDSRSLKYVCDKLRDLNKKKVPRVDTEVLSD